MSESDPPLEGRQAPLPVGTVVGYLTVLGEAETITKHRSFCKNGKLYPCIIYRSSLKCRCGTLVIRENYQLRRALELKSFNPMCTDCRRRLSRAAQLKLRRYWAKNDLMKLWKVNGNLYPNGWEYLEESSLRQDFENDGMYFNRFSERPPIFVDVQEMMGHYAPITVRGY